MHNVSTIKRVFVSWDLAPMRRFEGADVVMYGTDNGHEMKYFRNFRSHQRYISPRFLPAFFTLVRLDRCLSLGGREEDSLARMCCRVGAGTDRNWHFHYPLFFFTISAIRP